jgi:hypothetical protein
MMKYHLYSTSSIQTVENSSIENRNLCLLTPKRQAYDREISISIDTPFCNLIS